MRGQIESARAAGAQHWAPEALEHAQEAFQEVLRAVARQRRRPPLFRRFAPIHLQLKKADAQARALANTVQEARAATETTVAARLEEAGASLSEALKTTETVWMPRAGRTQMAEARILLAEARNAFARGEYGRSLLAADRVLETSRAWQGHSRTVLERSQDPSIIRTWREWDRQTVAYSRDQKVPAIVVDKGARLLFFYDSGHLARTFPVDLGLNPLADKLMEGDHATPEGRYRIIAIRKGEQTRYHRAFLLDYPNEEDRRHFRKAQENGQIPAQIQIGGLIEIHGEGGRGEDWTDGCVALTNDDMDYLAGKVQEGTLVTIVGALPAGKPHSPEGK